MYKLFFHIFCMLCLWPGKFSAQTDSLVPALKFEEEQFEAWKKQKDFHYLDRETQTNWWIEFKAWFNHQYQQIITWLFGEYEPNSVFAWFISALPYLLLVVTLFFIAWLFVRLNPAYAPAPSFEAPEVFYSEEEKMIRSKDISELIEGAKSNRHYRLAIRYYYVQSLQQLNMAKIINYHPEKTNTDYVAEISSDKIKRAFEKTTRIYEHIWYGDFKIERQAFLTAEKDFLNLQNALKQ